MAKAAKSFKALALLARWEKAEQRSQVMAKAAAVMPPHSADSATKVVVVDVSVPVSVLPVTAAESSAVANAIALLGLPYVWGGESTQTGFDCSGMVQYVYREVGIDLPRVAQNQYDAGPGVPPGSTVEPR